MYQAVYVPNEDVPHRAHRPDGAGFSASRSCASSSAALRSTSMPVSRKAISFRKPPRVVVATLVVVDGASPRTPVTVTRSAPS